MLLCPLSSLLKKLIFFKSYPIVQHTLLLVKFVVQLIVLHLIVTYRTAPCQNVDKTDVNQIYGEYYFSSNNERVLSVSEVGIDSRYQSNLLFKTLPGNGQQPWVQQHLWGEQQPRHHRPRQQSPVPRQLSRCQHEQLMSNFDFESVPEKMYQLWFDV